MPVLNFQPRFVQAIQTGHKKQSIRATWRDGRFPFRPGQQLYLYTGLRTPAARKIGQAVIVSVDLIHIDYDGIEIGEPPRPVEDLDEFAALDGFPGWEAMQRFWRLTHGLPFDGWLVQWSTSEER